VKTVARRSVLPLLALVPLVLMLTPVAHAVTGDVTLASTSSAGVKGNGLSYGSLSADGTKIGLGSNATNLDPGDTDSTYDVYVKDLATGDVTLASTSTSGAKANSISFFGSLSADGTKVAFDSEATNLDAADTDSILDIYVKDLVTGDLTLASTSTSGAKGDASSVDPFLSADGTKVTFASQAHNLDPAATGSTFEYDIYVKDLVTGELTLASTSNAGVKGNNSSEEPSLSADGTKVVFWSLASNLDPADSAYYTQDVYVKDLSTGLLTLVSTSDAGVAAGGWDPAISADGSTVAFSTLANLDIQDSDSLIDVYVKDFARGETTLASTASGKGNTDSFEPSLSADGTRVAFQSQARGKVNPSFGLPFDIFVKDLSTGDLAIASTSDGGTKAKGYSSEASLSADGTKVGFSSDAMNLDPADTDSLTDVYVKEVGPMLGGCTIHRTRGC
jgi:Tol biopolymer transport system component